MRILSDGSAIFPKRGLPPEIPEGYEATGNPFIFKLILQDCIHRDAVAIKDSCCPNNKILYCHHYDRHITRATCKGCEYAQ